MPNLTLAIPESLHQRMKKHSDIRWSDVVRRSLTEKIDILEEVERIAQKSKLTHKDVEEIAQEIDSAVAKRLGLK